MRPAPRAISELPEQYFTRLLAAAAAARATPGPRFIELGRGNPDMAPPDHAIEALRAAALEVDTPAVHGYPPFRGHASLKEALARRYAADHGVTLDPEREIAVVGGTKTGIVLTCVAVAGRGDTVLLPDPGYPDYPSGVALAGATRGALPLDPTAGFQPD
ncbi:MAG: Glutamine-dependent 2-keto-4-methylthiobutyrate transaminase, partial [uncultured Thermoleophilia bacterium]